MKELGARLRKKREDMNISIEELQKETKIRKMYLLAIEEGDEDRLPGEVYLKGFLRSYAQVVGLDPGEIMEEYKEIRNRDLQKEREELEETLKNEGDSLSPIVIHIFIILAIVAIILFSIYNIMRLNTEDEDLTLESHYEEEHVDGQQEDSLAQEDLKEIETIEVEEPKASTGEIDSFFLPFLKNGSVYLAIDRPIQDENEEDIYTRQEEIRNAISEEVEMVMVDMQAQERSWLLVQVDGEEVFQGFLEDGESLYFEGEEIIRIRVGNAGGLLLKDDKGEYTKPMGSRGAVKEFLFTLE